MMRMSLWPCAPMLALGGGGNLGDGSDASPFLDFDAPDRSPLRKVCHVHDDRHGKQIFFIMPVVWNLVTIAMTIMTMHCHDEDYQLDDGRDERRWRGRNWCSSLYSVRSTSHPGRSVPASIITTTTINDNILFFQLTWNAIPSNSNWGWWWWWWWSNFSVFQDLEAAETFAPSLSLRVHQRGLLLARLQRQT